MLHRLGKSPVYPEMLLKQIENYLDPGLKENN